MKDMETIKDINTGIRAIMMPMYNELVELRDKLNSLSSGSEHRKAKVKFDDLYKQYSLFGKSNDIIVKFTSIEEVKNELQRLTNERKRLYKEFISLKQEYVNASNSGRSISELNEIVTKA